VKDDFKTLTTPVDPISKQPRPVLVNSKNVVAVQDISVPSHHGRAGAATTTIPAKIGSRVFTNGGHAIEVNETVEEVLEILFPTFIDPYTADPHYTMQR